MRCQNFLAERYRTKIVFIRYIEQGVDFMVLAKRQAADPQMLLAYLI
jgi:hypothetical protein